MAHHTTAPTLQSTREATTRELFAELEATQDASSRHRLAERIVEVNLPLCDALANRYRGRGVDHDDLIQVARMALWLAIGRYRSDHGSSFGSFAIPTITGELKRHFRDHGWVIRPPRQLQELRAKAVAVRSDLEQCLGRTLHDVELAVRMDVDLGQLRASLAASDSYLPDSLDLPCGEDSGESRGSQLPTDDDLAATCTDRIALRRALNRLSQRDRSLLVWRFVDECTQREIAGRLGVSQMQVSRLIRAVLAELREEFEPTPLAG